MILATDLQRRKRSSVASMGPDGGLCGFPRGPKSISDSWTGRLAVASIGDQMRVYAIIDAQVLSTRSARR
jgi:hypothetical protein